MSKRRARPAKMPDWLRSGASAEARRLHWRVDRWTLDESPMAQRLYEPIVAVLDPRSRIVVLQHVGVLVGPTAHADLWPRIRGRLGAHCPMT